jgi:hypothetical protein
MRRGEYDWQTCSTLGCYQNFGRKRQEKRSLRIIRERRMDIKENMREINTNGFARLSG